MTLSVNINQQIGINLRIFRKEKKISQEDLAVIAGIQRTATISELETGKGNPTIETIEKLATALDIRPIELLDMGHFRSDEYFFQKEDLIKVHCESLLQRELEEVQYVVNSTNKLLDFIDKK